MKSPVNQNKTNSAQGRVHATFYALKKLSKLISPPHSPPEPHPALPQFNQSCSSARYIEL